MFLTKISQRGLPYRLWSIFRLRPWSGCKIGWGGSLHIIYSAPKLPLFMRKNRPFQLRMNVRSQETRVPSVRSVYPLRLKLNRSFLWSIRNHAWSRVQNAAVPICRKMSRETTEIAWNPQKDPQFCASGWSRVSNMTSTLSGSTVTPSLSKHVIRAWFPAARGCNWIFLIWYCASKDFQTPSVGD